MNEFVADELKKLQEELDECHIGQVELDLYLDTKEIGDEPRIRKTMRLWADARGHHLRNPMHSQHFTKLSIEQARDWLSHRLTTELVFESEAMNKWHARRITDSIFSLFNFESAYMERFIIKDYTFSEVAIFSDTKDSIVVAFVGED